MTKFDTLYKQIINESQMSDKAQSDSQESALDSNKDIFKKLLRKYNNNGRLSNVLDSLSNLKDQGNKDAARVYRSYHSGRIAGSESELLAALKQLATE